MSERKASLQSAFSGAVMLIGVAVLLLVDAIDFWPWILAVLALAALPRGIARGGLLGGGLAAAWLIGLAVLFATETFWPGILLLIGLSVIVGALVRLTGAGPRPSARPKARKRGR